MNRKEIKHQLYLLKCKLDKKFDSNLVTQIRKLEGQLKKATARNSSPHKI